MPYIFGLIFWFIVFCILAAILSAVGFACSIIIFRKSEKKIRKVILSTILPGASALLWFFLFNLELLIYSVVYDTDPGLGDCACVNINDQYKLVDIDDSGWNLVERESTLVLVQNIEEIFADKNKILVSSQIRSVQPDTVYYKLYEIDTIENSLAAIDSANIEQLVWKNYIKEYNIDSNKIFTCYNYYREDRFVSHTIFVVIDLLICILLSVFIWKFFCKL